jgi:hypothetical protein
LIRRLHEYHSPQDARFAEPCLHDGVDRGHDSAAQPVVVSASIRDTQGSACWVAITPSGRFAYVANTGSSSVSSYRISAAGAIELAAGLAAS